MYNPYFNGHRQPPDIPDDAEFNEVDQYGRRFRKVGNCIEYEPEINGMPRSVFFARQKAQKQRDEEKRKQEAAALAAAQTGRDCPFKISRNNVQCSCEKSCAFYQDTACVFARMDRPATKDTKDMDCIIARKCNERCAMYNHGCTLIDFVKGMKPGKE
jgi:hypothetical protein